MIFKIIKHLRLFTGFLIILLLPLVVKNSYATKPGIGKIDRKAVVTRHNLIITNKNLKGPSQVGNGEFAYGFDITGMQTFSNGANTMSNWGWHQFSLPAGQTPADFRGQKWDTQGRMIRYDIQNPEQQKLSDWMRGNPQRINLGRHLYSVFKNIGLAIFYGFPYFF
jgi:hypothetical protein